MGLKKTCRYAVFRIKGQEYKLRPYIEEPGATQLFYVFRDLTAGKETYGAGRFFYTDFPKDGKVVLDFNKAYNPPCAFTPYATCPLPPPRINCRCGLKPARRSTATIKKNNMPPINADEHR